MIGLIFDVDGVVGDTESINAAVTVEVFRDLCGIEVKPGDFRPFVGTGAERYVQGVAERYGVAIDLPQATRLRERKILETLRREGLKPYPGVADLIDAAAEAPDVRLGLATSAHQDLAFAILAAAGIDRSRFDALITGEAVTRKKPDPAIYLLAADRLRLAPSACVVIEDAPSGVAAADAAGMRCIAVTNTVEAERLKGADRIVASLAEVSLGDIRQLARESY